MNATVDRLEVAEERVTMIIQKGAVASGLTVDFGPPPTDARAVLASTERARRNSEWLQAHWADLLPQARGKFVAVAAAEAFIAESPEEAWAWARRTHPEDDTATVQYVNTHLGPKIYAHRG
jgi:hypothetical protein